MYMKVKFDPEIFLLSGGVFWFSTPTVSNKNYKTTCLARGSRGRKVRLLQEHLIQLGFELPGYGADGIYGCETESAVAEFQRRRGLVPDGVVGADTLMLMRLWIDRGNRC